MEIYTLENFKFAFDFLESLKDIREDLKHHPEKDALNHSLQVLELAFKESQDIDLILSAMLHDIGKAHFVIDHDKIAIELLKDYVSVKTLWLIEHHIRIRYLLEGKIVKLSKVEYLINHPWLPELILLTRWDKMGRIPDKTIKYDKEYILKRLNQCADKHFKNLLDKL
jgi:hypothetical protein